MTQWRDRVAIVTGGASGIGRAVCEALGAEGAIVVAADIDAEGAREVARSVTATGGRARAAELDITRAGDVQELVAATASAHGRLDYLFNNAGIAMAAELQDIDLGLWRRIVEVNLMGVVHGTAAAYPIMVRQGSGHIVNTASMAGILPVPTQTAYCATKHAVVGLSTALRMEGADLGVRVSVVCPGLIQTGIFGTATVLKVDRAALLAKLPFAPMAAGAAARVILRDVERNRAVITVPGYARPFWWCYRLAPVLVSRWGLRLVREFRALRRES